MIFYTILFSLDKPEKNWYFYMMMMLYKSLVATESVGPADKFFVVCDKATAEFGRRLPSLRRVLWVEVAPVDSVKNGMLYKYIFRPKVDEVVLYLDCDFLATKKVSLDLPPDTFAYLQEGRPDDSNYCGAGGSLGASAGIFGFRYGPRCKQILDEIGLRTMNCSKGFYTLDQPHYNAVLAEATNRVRMEPWFVSFNGHGDPRAALINCAGIPGDGPFHFQKMMDFFIRS